MKWDGHDIKTGAFGVLAQERNWDKVIFDEDEDLFNWNLAATADVLPTNSVLKCWNTVSGEQAKCNLCHERLGSLRHILCGCQVALRQGRQTWRHDSILLTIYKMLRELRNRGAAKQKSRTKTPDLEPPNKVTRFVTAFSMGRRKRCQRKEKQHL